MTSTTTRAALRMLFAFLGFSALVTEVATLVNDDRFTPANFFSFFTVESNTLAVISLVLGAFAAISGRRSRALDLFRGAVAFYMTTVIIIFIVLLSGLPASELTAVPWDNTVLHYVMPVVVLGDWVLDSGTTRLTPRHGLLWLLFPLAYLVYSLVRGAIVDWYPYPFMNPDEHGYLAVAVTSVVIAVVLAGISSAIASVPRLSGAGDPS